MDSVSQDTQLFVILFSRCTKAAAVERPISSLNGSSRFMSICEGCGDRVSAAVQGSQLEVFYSSFLPGGQRKAVVSPAQACCSGQARIKLVVGFCYGTKVHVVSEVAAGPRMSTFELLAYPDLL